MPISREEEADLRLRPLPPRKRTKSEPGRASLATGTFSKEEEAAIEEELKIDAGRTRDVGGGDNGDLDDNPKPVNYGYHPIIDFFDRYRWSAASR